MKDSRPNTPGTPTGKTSWSARKQSGATTPISTGTLTDEPISPMTRSRASTVSSRPHSPVNVPPSHDPSAAKKSILKQEKPGLLKQVSKMVLLQVKERTPKPSDEDERRRKEALSTGRSRRSSRVSIAHLFKETNVGKYDNYHLLRLAIKEDIRKRRLLQKFKFLIRFRTLLERWWKTHIIHEIDQNHPLFTAMEVIDRSLHTLPEDNNNLSFEPGDFKSNRQMRMSHEAKKILTKKPKDRTDSEIHYAMIALRGIDSIAGYPLRMQRALAKYGMFEAYGPKRIVVKQDHRPDAFYFILYGTVLVAVIEPEHSYAKIECYLYRGQAFGELAIAHKSTRQSTVITSEYTEFLSIDTEAYEKLFMVGGVQSRNDPDHKRFMNGLFYLKDWPLAKLEDKSTQIVQFCYFRRNIVMVADSNFSDWIYIVKSGSLRVLKRLQKVQSSVCKKTGHFINDSIQYDGFLAFLTDETDFRRFAVYNGLDIPRPLSESGSDSSDEDVDDNPFAYPLKQRIEMMLRPRTATGGCMIETYGRGDNAGERRQIRTARDRFDKPKEPLIATSKDREDSGTPTTGRKSVDPFLPRAPSAMSTTFSDDRLSSAPVFIREICSGEDKGGHKLHYSASFNRRTYEEDQDFAGRQQMMKGVKSGNPEFVQILTLTKGQAFGLQYLTVKDDKPLFEDQPSLSVVSNGAECIMLNKKFYVDNCLPGMLERVKAEILPFASDAQMQDQLGQEKNWKTFKKIHLKNTIKRQMEGRPPKLTNHKRGATTDIYNDAKVVFT